MHSISLDLPTRRGSHRARSSELDAEYAAGLRRLLTRAMEDPRNFDVALEAAFVLKSLERIGDHARNLARHVQWIGQDAPQPQVLPCGRVGGAGIA